MSFLTGTYPSNILGAILAPNKSFNSFMQFMTPSGETGNIVDPSMAWTSPSSSDNPNPAPTNDRSGAEGAPNSPVPAWGTNINRWIVKSFNLGFDSIWDLKYQRIDSIESFTN